MKSTVSTVVFILVGVLMAAFGARPFAVSTVSVQDNSAAMIAQSTATRVCIEPVNGTAGIGELYAVSVSVVDVENLYGFDIQIGWETSVLQYIGHDAMAGQVGGVLNSPVFPVKEVVDETVSIPGSAPGTTFWYAAVSFGGAPSFNGTGTAFTVTFLVLSAGECDIVFTGTQLADTSIPSQPIPHVAENAHFLAWASTIPSDMPVVFVDPLNATADVGESFTMSVKVFNLTGDTYTSNDPWVEGEALPPFVESYYRYKYSLGNIYGFDLQLSWDPTILQYVTHTVTVPVEDYSGGILHGPIIEAADAVDPDAGTYWLVRVSQAPAEMFNAPGENATAFTMTFNVVKPGKCAIRFTNVDLPVNLLELGTDYYREAPHWTIDGQFQTGEAWTRIEKIDAGTPIAGVLYDPVIHGEDVTVNVTVRNDGFVADTYNLTLREETTLLDEWLNEVLAPGTSKVFTHIIMGSTIRVHTLTAEATILHGSEEEADQITKNFTVIDIPALRTSGPCSALTGQTVNFNASESVHNDPNGSITTYTWTLWAPGETAARDTETGESVSFALPSETEKIGNWTVMLVVEDNYGITPEPLTGGGVVHLKPTSQLLRPAAEPYRALSWLEVYEPLVISILTPENKSYPTDDVPLVFTVNLAASWLGYSLDGQPNATITGNTTLSTLADGPHTVLVYANDTFGQVKASNAVHFAVDTTQPIADGGADQTVDEDTMVTLNGSESSDNLGIAAFMWAFTDATAKILKGKTPTYTFDTPGIFTVTLKVTDAAGNWATATVTVTVLDVTKPVADAGGDQTANEDSSVTLDGSASSDNVAIATYSWRFTDRTSKTLSDEKPIYTFNTPGIYAITLNVTDAAGNWATDTVTVTISDTTEPTANAGDDKTVNVGATVAFDAGHSIDNVDIVSYDWNFGDGSSSTGETATHTYANAGEYTVTLTVKDAEGNQANDTLTVNVVSAGGLPGYAIGAAVAGILLAVGAALVLRKTRK